jgi:hypothetical protein
MMQWYRGPSRLFSSGQVSCVPPASDGDAESMRLAMLVDAGLCAEARLW